MKDTKTKKMLPLSSPQIEGNAWKYVKECLDTQWVSSVGRYVGLFEENVARFTGSDFAVATSNGTAALHTMLRLHGLGPGDAVIVPALTFIATANAVAYTNATCLFADCEPRRFNIDLDKLEEYLARRCARKGDRLITKDHGLTVKAMLATHILGYPMDMARVVTLCKKYGIIPLEDAAESIGSYWRGRHTGTFGAMGALSFNGNKIITTGGGGMILTRDKRMALRAKHVTQQAKAEPFEYVHDEIGFNYRLTNIAAALGLSQIELLPGFLKKRKRIADWYGRFLPQVFREPDGKHAIWNRWLLSVEVADATDRDRLLSALNSRGCQARPLWRPVPMQKPFLGSPGMEIPNAKDAYDTVLNIPSSTSLLESDVQRICKILRQFELKRLIA